MTHLLHGNVIVMLWCTHFDLLKHLFYQTMAIGEEVWHAVAEALSVTRVGRQGTVCDNGYRSAQVSILLGVNGCVRHIENGIV